MKIQLVSDLHLEFFHDDEESGALAKKIAETEADVLLLAGDICTLSRRARYEDFLNWLYATGKYKKIFFIAGNHEYYHSSITDDKVINKHWQLPADVEYLSAESRIVDDVAFFGATLWTDFNKNNPLDKGLWRRYLNDSNYIAGVMGPLHPDEVLDIHYEHKKALVDFLANEKAEKKVVFTHHGPCGLSISPKFLSSPLNYSWVSDLADIMLEYKPNLWLHGHTHDSLAYEVGDTKVYANPKGYGGENPNFKTDFIIEV